MTYWEITPDQMRSLLCKFAVYLSGLLIIMCAVEKLGASRHPEQTSYFVYVGTYTKSIYAYRFDATAPKVDAIGPVGELVNVSFLATDPHYRFLYAVSEADGDANGGVSAVAINRKNGSLKFLNSASSAG